METTQQLLHQCSNQKILEVPKPKIGVLIVNTGTPSGYTYFPMRAFLAEFLSDRRMIELPRILWWPILHFFILTFRPFRKGRCYRLIWNVEEDESPLRTTTRSQAKQLASIFKSDGIEVDWAFRYGEPSISATIQCLKEKGCDRLVLIPLFPQYAAATTASVSDEAFRTLQQQRHQMSVRVVPAFYSNKAYINATAKKIQQKIAEASFEPEVLILSYHGLPVKCQENGDPYGPQCYETSCLLRESLRLPATCQCFTAFQSRYGFSEWLKPYTDELVLELARFGLKRMVVAAPGFMSDCLETSKEIEIDLAKVFCENGGEEFVYVPCLNDSPEGIDVIESLIRWHIKGFLK